MKTDDDKIAFFEAELLRIFDYGVREFTRLCITQAPDYIFEDCPSSSSGKYHPLDELSHDGTIIHTKKVFTLAYELVKAFDCESSRDLVLSACIIHDLRKQGLSNSGHTVKDHPDLAADLVSYVQKSTQLLTEDQFNIIRNCVGYHYGPWSESPWKKPMSGYTSEELTVFISDYTVSKRFIYTDFRRENGQ